MKTIKFLPLTLLFAVSYACAMSDDTVGHAIQAVRTITSHQDPVHEAKTLLKVAESQGTKLPLYLHTAILDNNMPALEIFLNANAPKNKDAKGRTPLVCAIDEDNAAAIAMLFKYPQMREYDLTNKVNSKETLRAYCHEVAQVAPRDQNPKAWIEMTTAIRDQSNLEITQEFIDNGQVYIPNYSKTNHASIDSAVENLLDKAKKKKITLPKDICTQAQQYLLSYQLDCADARSLCRTLEEFKEHADNPDLSPLLKQIRYDIAHQYALEYIHADKQSKYYECHKREILAHLTPDVKEYFDENNDLTWQLYMHAVANNDSDVIEKICETTSIMNDLATSLNNAIAMLHTLNNVSNAPANARQKAEQCIVKARAIAHLNSNLFKKAMKKSVANMMFDISQKYDSTLSQEVYDYVSDDRVPWRQYNLFYQYRKCTDPDLAAAQRDEEEISTASASETTTQSDQTNTTSDNACAHDDTPTENATTTQSDQTNVAMNDDESKKDK